MLSLYTFSAPPSPCGYLPDRRWRLRYEVVAAMSAPEYAERLTSGWRRFGYSIFTPDCPKCRACQSLRVPTDTFAMSDSQKRAWKLNAGAVRLEIGVPSVSDEKLALYDRFHASQSAVVGWPERGPESAAEYGETFVENPFPVEEWCYYFEGKLVGVGYVDPLPVGPSAVYFYHEPELRKRSLGTFNVLSIIDVARRAGMPHVYLGFMVEGCRSLEYKAKFRPNEVLVGEEWRAQRPHPPGPPLPRGEGGEAF